MPSSSGLARSEAAVLADPRTMRILSAVAQGRVNRAEGTGPFAEYDLAGLSVKLSVHFLAEEGLLDLHPAGPPHPHAAGHPTGGRVGPRGVKSTAAPICRGSRPRFTRGSPGTADGPR